MIPRLNLDRLHERHPGLTVSLGGTFAEAASVCLNRHHNSPVEIELAYDAATKTCMAEFVPPTAVTLRAWGNHIDTTEFGAYGVCLAAVELEQGFVAVRRAETLTGADWYVGSPESSVDDLENCFRLEVSGVDAGNRSAVNERLRRKVEQTRRGASNLPAIAAVVGFKQLAIAIQNVENV
jgi:hypothetical protein